MSFHLSLDKTASTLPFSGLKVAFKEWSGVCDALGSGRQSVVIRKGGVAEGPTGFVPEHSAFWLFPTHLHQSEQGLREQPRDVADAGRSGSVRIGTLVVVDRAIRVDSLERLDAISDYHIWSSETVYNRFHYRSPGVWVLLVRAYNREPEHWVKVSPEYAGCRSWVDLTEALEAASARPVLQRDEFARRCEAVSRLLLEPHRQASNGEPAA